MNKVLLSRIEIFNKSIEHLTVRDAVRIAKKEVKELLKVYKETTVRAYLTIYKQNLKRDNANIIKALSLPKSVQNSIEKKATKRIAKANRKGTKIHNVENMFCRAIELLDSNKIEDLVIGLCLLTGRRMTEILKTAKFTNSRNSQKVAYFKGQLKAVDKNLKYEIYMVGGTRDLCKAALKRLRGLAKTQKMSNREVSRKYEWLVNTACKRYFNHHVGRRDIDVCTVHTLRHIYALFCLKHYKKYEWQTDNSFLSYILGHEELDVITANSYQRYFI